jgi:hypothetical protein
MPTTSSLQTTDLFVQATALRNQSTPKKSIPRTPMATRSALIHTNKEALVLTRNPSSQRPGFGLAQDFGPNNYDFGLGAVNIPSVKRDFEWKAYLQSLKQEQEATVEHQRKGLMNAAARKTTRWGNEVRARDIADRSGKQPRRQEANFESRRRE